MIDKKVKHYYQTSSSCWPTSLRMIVSKDYKNKRLSFFNNICWLKYHWTTIYNLADAAMILWYSTILYQNARWLDLINYFNKNYSIIVLYSIGWIIWHYSTVKKINWNFIWLLDPLSGLKKYKIEDFIKIWKVKHFDWYHNFLAIK